MSGPGDIPHPLLLHGFDFDSPGILGVFGAFSKNSTLFFCVMTIGPSAFLYGVTSSVVLGRSPGGSEEKIGATS